MWIATIIIFPKIFALSHLCLPFYKHTLCSNFSPFLLWCICLEYFLRKDRIQFNSMSELCCPLGRKLQLMDSKNCIYVVYLIVQIGSWKYILWIGLAIICKKLPPSQTKQSTMGPVHTRIHILFSLKSTPYYILLNKMIKFDLLHLFDIHKCIPNLCFQSPLSSKLYCRFVQRFAKCRPLTKAG